MHRADARRAAAPAPAATFTIEELAAKTGMTVRNIRAHQSRGLLPGPKRRGRIGYYNQAHVDRLLRIKDLQTQGFNLAAIAVVMQAGGEERPDYRMLQRLALEPMLRQDSFVVERRALAEMFRHPRDDQNLGVAVEIGLLRWVDEDRLELPSRALAAAAQQLIDLGFGAKDLLDLQAALVQGTSQVAEMFVDLCLHHAWDPFAAEGYPAERWHEVRAAFERLHEQAAAVLMATFAMTVRTAAERRLDEQPRPDPRD